MDATSLIWGMSVKEKPAKAQERLRRLGRAYVDGVYDDDEYRRQKRTLEMELESLVVPEADAAGEAGRLIEKLPELWAGASMEERRKLLLTMLEAVYVDIKDERRIVAIRPKAPFKPVFQVATKSMRISCSRLASARDRAGSRRAARGRRPDRRCRRPPA